jgi:putative ABC transport system substrate-binding protein
MKKIIILTLLLICGLTIFLRKNIFNNAQSSTKTNNTIGIVIPLTHPALQKIVDGFCKKMNQLSGNAYSFMVRDAHGDQAVQQPAIIDDMIDRNATLLVSIGTLCTQMAVQKTNHIPIIGLASSRDSTSQSANAYSLTDEISATHHCSFIQSLIPAIDKIALIATQSEKTIPEIERFRTVAMNAGISIQIIYIQNTSELYLATHSIDADAQAIFILKDHAVVSGITTIIQYAEENQIPVIASDEGSVEQGASCALGVQESSIGEEGAQLAFELLSTGSLDKEKINDMTNLSVFVNTRHAKAQNLNLARVKTFCAQMNYPLEEKR